MYAVRSVEFPSFEIKTEADSNDICECSQDDKPSTGMLGLFRHFCNVVKLTCCSVPGTHDHHLCIVNLSNKWGRWGLYDFRKSRIHIRVNGATLQHCHFVLDLLDLSLCRSRCGA